MTDISASARISTYCSAECGGASEVFLVCKEASDCDNGAQCNAFVCSAGDTNRIVLGLCTETAPLPCE